VASKWDTAPDISGSAVTLVSFGAPAINVQGHAAFQATFSESQRKLATQSGIWVETGTDGVLTQVARTGVSMPYLSGSNQLTVNFTALSDPVLNAQDMVAFQGTWRSGAAVTRANNQGIWVTGSSGTLTLVGQIRGQAPGCPDGAVFSSFSKLALLDNGGVVFIANLARGAGGVVWGNDQGIWAMGETGQVILMAREGDLLPVGSGTKKIAALSIFNSDASASGQTRSFSSNRDLIYKAVFVDGSQGIYTLMLP
jgi:hypothetical protein